MLISEASIILPKFYIIFFFELFSIFAFSFFIPCLISFIISKQIIKKELLTKKDRFNDKNYIQDTKRKLKKSGIFFIISNVLWIINLFIENNAVFDETKLFKFLHYYGIDVTFIFLVCIVFMLFVSFTFLMICYNRLKFSFTDDINLNNSLRNYLNKIRISLIIYFIVLGIISIVISVYESEILRLLYYIF